jgi:aspartate/methionine/tyrosine aminotransferase
MFSARLPHERSPNAVTTRLAAMRRAGVRLFDLTETNPTRVGLPVAPGLAHALDSPRAAMYEPAPFGLEDAREAVRLAYAASHAGLAVGIDQIVLTATTSEAYSFLFKLLCNPGETVLVPRPSYPLFDLLGGLDAVRLAPYRLDPHDGWSIDRGSLERALAPDARAVLVVSPNNPTGSLLDDADREWLVALAAARNLAIVSDEVFADYPLSPRPGATSLLGETRALTFTLGGLSKSAALPQMKLAWIVASGPDAQRTEALERLELIADTYLSVSTPVQVAAAALMTLGLEARRAVGARVAANLDGLRAHLGRHPALTLLEPEAGWTAVVRVPAVATEEQLVLRLLDEAQVLVHPGYFFDFEGEAFLVMSLLPAPEVFSEGVSRLTRLLAGGRS